MKTRVLLFFVVLLLVACGTSQPAPTLTPTPARTLDPSVPPQSAALGDTWTRPADEMVMVYVPAGEFDMGTDEEDVDHLVELCEGKTLYQRAGCDDRSDFQSEQPAHAVALDSFWIDQTELTNAQYQRCVDAGVCPAPTTCDGGAPSYGDASKANHPAVCVDWDDAQAYCEWAGGRLPTEAEWEYAARGADGRTFPWGNTPPDCDKGNFWQAGGAEAFCRRVIVPVGRYPAGASWCGALDMAGNVWELVADWYGEYPSGRQVNPQGPSSGDSRVLRGGSPLYEVRSASRGKFDAASHFVGFRCARGSD